MKQPNLKTLTTGLAGAAALAGGTEAYGAVVSASLPASFTPTSGVTNPANVVTWDINADGNDDFAFAFHQTATGGNWYSGIYGYGGAGIAAAIGYAGPNAYIYVNRLPTGYTISGTSGFMQTAYFSIFASRFNSNNYGQFTNPNRRGFAGFEFSAADGLHFGYIELQVAPFSSAGDPGGMQFFQAFWETTPNTPITIIPEPGTLASLAFGSATLAGLALARRRKSGSES